MTTVTLSTDERSVTMTGEQFDAAVDAMTGGDDAVIPGPGKFAGADFLDAPDLKCIADRLIASSAHLAHLRQWSETIAYLWKQKGGKKGGRATLGSSKALSGSTAFYAHKSYEIWLAADHCRDAHLTDRQLEALVFHQLCCFGPDEEAEELGVPAPPVVVGPDFSGFLAELEEYGFWRPDLEAARGAFEQLPLFGEVS